MRESRIVIVEDNAGDVLFVREALKHQGIAFSMQHYASGDAALKALVAMQEAPDLILLDLNLPRVSGFELLKTVRNHEVLANVPVAIITSSVAAVDKTTGQRLGADAYIVKPSDYEEFMTGVGGELASLVRRGMEASGETQNPRGRSRCSHRPSERS
jgi:two-component system, chemotaxis family, response regulator Rcp1